MAGKLKMNIFKASNFKIVLVALLFAVTGNASAADEIILEQITGEISVNQGEKYVVANEGMVVMPGDQLLVADGGLGRLVYPNGCVLEVTGEFILSVASEAPCVAGALLATAGGAATTGATLGTAGTVALILVGAAGIAAIADDDDKGTISQ